MNFDRLMNVFSIQDPAQKQMSRLGIYSDSLSEQALYKTLAMYSNKNSPIQEQTIIKNLLKNLENKNSVASKLKIISLLLQISKETQYDIADVIMTRKMKIFTKISKLKFPQTALDKKTVDIYICSQLIVPIYNYLMKLSVNQQLYKICLSQKVPFDDIFRRGSKIRFIWIFKVYNLIHLLIPLLTSLLKLLEVFPNFSFCRQLSTFFYSDMVLMNDFVVLALNEAAQDNFVVMPYFDMLQFYESMVEQTGAFKKISDLYRRLAKFNESAMEERSQVRYRFKEPNRLQIKPQVVEAIQVQALRVKLISNTLKNPKKDHTRLQTEYNQKSRSKTQTQKPKSYFTQFLEIDQKENSFTEKFKNLD